MTTLPLDEIKARAEAAAALAGAATPGPWVVETDGDYNEFTDTSSEWPDYIHKVCDFNSDRFSENSGANSTFIAASRTAVPALAADVTALLADNERLVAEIAALRADLIDTEKEVTLLDNKLAKR